MNETPHWCGKQLRLRLAGLIDLNQAIKIMNETKQ